MKKKEFNLWFINLYKGSSAYTASSFKLIYNFLGKRWYLNLFYNRYVASVSFFLGYHSTFILLDKGFFEAPSLLSIRFIGDISKFLSLKFYRFFYFGEMLLYFFLIYSLFFFCFFLDFSLFFEIFFPNVFSFLEESFFSFFFLAVPKKRKRIKKLPHLKTIVKGKSLSAIYLNFIESKVNTK